MTTLTDPMNRVTSGIYGSALGRALHTVTSTLQGGNVSGDSLSRLTKISWAAGKTTQFKYNALGQRCERIDTSGGSVATRYDLRDGAERIDSRSGTSANSATIDRRYFSQGEQRKNGSTWENYHYCRDHLGSIREVVKSVGTANTLVARYDYDPYGKRLTQYQAGAYTGGCDFGYTGHDTLPSLESGQPELVLTLFRAYDPALGRWLSADPMERVTGDLPELMPGASNLYSYVVNDPINRWDPLGLVDSVDTGITSMMFKGDIEGLKMVLQGLEGPQAQTCRMAIEKVSQPVVRLIKGSLKRSRSYDTGLENETIQELARMAREGSSKAAKMLKLLKNEGRILDKCKG